MNMNSRYGPARNRVGNGRPREARDGGNGAYRLGLNRQLQIGSVGNVSELERRNDVYLVLAIGRADGAVSPR